MGLVLHGSKFEGIPVLGVPLADVDAAFFVDIEVVAVHEHFVRLIEWL